jgi:uncharacterized protein DUF4389
VATTTSPVRLDARLDGEPSRGLWLVKWLLLIPHVIVLFFLWLAFPVLSFVALIAILVTGRYPHGLFEFNVGVLRWTWRVWFYGYGALGTDRYPPFSLDEEPDYPATLHIEPPGELSRGLALVKWWLLAIPHYLVVTFFVGGGGYVLWQFGDRWFGFDGGLVALLTLFAGLALLFTGRYPRDIFDLVVGMNRWVLRVAAYAALMTDEYPPFRLDTGGTDPASAVEPPPVTAETPVAEGAAAETPVQPAAGPMAAETSSTGPAAPRTRSAGRVIGVIVGVVVLLIGLGVTVGGGALVWLDNRRGTDGYLSTPVGSYSDGGYALRFDAGEISPVDRGWPGVDNVLGTVRVRASGTGDEPVFVGIARTADVDAYLAGVPHRMYQGTGGMARMHRRPPPGMPMGQHMWVASDSGTGPMTLHWTPRAGEWSLVVMNSSARPDVRADIAVAASAPNLGAIAVGVLVGGILALLVGTLVIVLSARRGPPSRGARP